jgi:hypothetical protein
MIEKFAKKDGLFFHKIGLILGIIAGFLIGLVVSDRADRFEIEEAKEKEVAVDGSEKDRH